MAADDHVPANAEAYLPTIVGHPGATVDVADSRYISARAAAHKAGLSQAQFSQLLGFEASRVAGQSKPAAPAVAETPAAAPARAAPEVPYAEMSMSQKLAKFGHG